MRHSINYLDPCEALHMSVTRLTPLIMLIESHLAMDVKWGYFRSIDQRSLIDH